MLCTADTTAPDIACNLSSPSRSHTACKLSLSVTLISILEKAMDSRGHRTRLERDITWMNHRSSNLLLTKLIVPFKSECAS